MLAQNEKKRRIDQRRSGRPEGIAAKLIILPRIDQVCQSQISVPVADLHLGQSEPPPGDTDRDTQRQCDLEQMRGTLNLLKNGSDPVLGTGQGPQNGDRKSTGNGTGNRQRETDALQLRQGKIERGKSG